MRRITRAVAKQRGQSLVEFALVLPVVLLLIFGLLEFGRVINAEITAGHCANELARYAIVGHTEEEVRLYAYDTPICPTFDLSDDEVGLEVNVEHPAGEGVGRAVLVTINYPIDIVVPLIRDIPGLFTDGQYIAHGYAEMQME